MMIMMIMMMMMVVRRGSIIRRLLHPLHLRLPSISLIIIIIIIIKVIISIIVMIIIKIIIKIIIINLIINLIIITMITTITISCLSFVCKIWQIHFIFKARSNFPTKKVKLEHWSPFELLWLKAKMSFRTQVCNKFPTNVSF